METVDKKHGKIIDEILSFESAVDDFASFIDDQNQRSGFIVGNGRVNYFLDEDDVEKICKEKGFTPRQIVGVKEEFDNDRLIGIWDHTCEVLSDQYTDWLLGCAYDDYNQQVYLYSRFLDYQKEDCETCYLEDAWEVRASRTNTIKGVGSEIRHYYKRFQEYFEQGISAEDLRKKFDKEHAEEIKQKGYLDLLNNRATQVWGGKYPSIVSVDTAAIHDCHEVSDLIWGINEAKGELTNKDFYDVLLGRTANYQIYDSVQEVLDLIRGYKKDFQQMEEAINFVHEYIDGEVNYFKEYLLERLSNEIDDFINDEFSLEERVKEGLAKVNTFKEILSDEIVTDLSARAKISRIKEVIQDFSSGKNVEGEFIGGYKINKVFTVDDETYFKIGCHLFKLSEAKEKLAV
jgi:hypothetical protein